MTRCACFLLLFCIVFPACAQRMLLHCGNLYDVKAGKLLPAMTIVVQGEMKEFPNFPLERVTVKFITIKSARGHSFKACELALEQLASKRFPLEKVTTHRFGLKDVDLAIRSVGGQGVPDVIHASLMPWE